jgi:F-type H+-transporting ATPase subunit delta
MPNPRLAYRYAKSVIDLSIEMGVLEKVYADMSWLKSVCKSNRDFVNMVRSPIINADTKKKIVAAIIKSRVTELTSRFISLLISKGRESYLPEIIVAFIASYKVHKNIQIVKLTTAVPVTEEVKNSIINHVKKAGGFEQIELEEKVDPDIVGGFVLQVGDKLVDASIAYDLHQISRQFDKNEFIYKIR